MHSINVHALRHYIRLVPDGTPEACNLHVKVASDIINYTNYGATQHTVVAAFAFYEFELGASFDEYFDRRMIERLKELSGAIVAFSNRESDKIYGWIGR